MKTKELIRLLTEADPDLDGEVVVNNIDIFSVNVEPGYWDGSHQILVRDPKKAPYYDVVGGIIKTQGVKIVISTMDLESALFDCEAHGDHFPIEFDTANMMNPESRQRYVDMVEEWRKEAREFYESREERAKGLEEIQMNNFC